MRSSIHNSPLGCSFGSRGSLLEVVVSHFLSRLWADEHGQDIAEYAVLLAVILIIVVGTVRLIGSNTNTVFSEVASSVQ